MNRIHAMRRAALLLLAVCLSCMPAMLTAQCKVRNTAFAAGESVKYDLYYDLGLIWKKVGFASLTTRNSTSQKDAYDLELMAVGNKTADAIFRLRDTLSCRISTDLVPLYYKKAAEEGKRYTIDQAWYTYNNGVTNVRQKRIRPGKDDIDTSASDSRCIYDMLSIIARARNFDMSAFEKSPGIKLPLATGRKVEEVTLTYLGKEEIKGKDGRKYRCLGFSIVTHDDKDDEDEEILRFHVTDDGNHLPVKINFSLKIGAAVAYLKSYEGTLYPFDSVVK